MKKWAAIAIALVLAGCSSAQKAPDENELATMEDFDKVEVYEGPEGSGDTRKNKPDEPEPEPGNEPTPEPDADVTGPETETRPEPKRPTDEPEREVKEPDNEPEAEIKVPEKEPDTEPDAVALKRREKLATEFIRAVNLMIFNLEESKAWKAYANAVDSYDDAYDIAKKKRKDDDAKGLEQAWADAIEAWYEARYFQTLFLHLYSPSSDFMPVFIHDRDEVLTLDDEELGSKDCRLTQAASELVSGKSKALNQFRTDALKYDLTAGNVHRSKKWQKQWKDEKEKWQDGANGKFDDKEIKKYSN